MFETLTLRTVSEKFRCVCPEIYSLGLDTISSLIPLLFDAPPHSPIATETLLAIALGSFLVSFSNPHVPGAAIITMTTGLAAAGLPLEGVAIGAGVDRLTDGFKTVIKCDWQCFQRGHVEPLGKAQNK